MRLRNRCAATWPLALALTLGAGAEAASPPGLRAAAPASDSALAAAVHRYDYEALRALGPAVLPRLVELYRATADPAQRADVAAAFYYLGWESPEAKRVLLADVGTDNERLRVQVQWALGRVSSDPDVVDRLLATMEHDPNALFRDKAACALANDQIHLGGAARFDLARRVVDRLESPDLETRGLAIRILQVLTGQLKGYLPAAPAELRSKAVARWRAWLEDYRRSL